jgi:hypothetical protein
MISWLYDLFTMSDNKETIIANLKQAVWNHEKITIATGIFDPKDILKALGIQEKSPVDKQ